MTSQTKTEIYGSKSDIKLSSHQYDSFIDDILDDRLDDHMMLKFKKLAHFNNYNRFTQGKKYI